MLGNEAKTITPFEEKVWLSSPTMHGDELSPDFPADFGGFY